MNIVDRFMQKVEKTDKCWEWKASKIKEGYGRFGIGSRTDGSRRLVLAHRFSYEEFVGPIPDGLEIDHLCKNPSCVRPDHLEAVTRRENVLRGNGWSGRNARKTHCPRGHEYTEENTLRAKKGGRWCRTCEQARNKARHKH